ncbi:hypothetical protein L2E82_02184 [Cichorium intybus]|uniref:Uncharacterized protein n=1 Tax=Cichorium intybus TaxID=13427 RepID=A0ACB9H238_CICIN|nr:hypothetical protein L2E82_02184 [Cichorium intybus]
MNLVVHVIVHFVINKSWFISKVHKLTFLLFIVYVGLVCWFDAYDLLPNGILHFEGFTHGMAISSPSDYQLTRNQVSKDPFKRVED